MTDTNDKLRALVLAALMVFSVFAGTIALTGTAAAATIGSASATDVTPNGDTGQVDIQLTNAQLDSANNNGNITIDVSSLDDAGVNLSDASATIESGDTDS